MTKRTIAAVAGLGLMAATLGACSTLAGAGLGAGAGAAIGAGTGAGAGKGALIGGLAGAAVGTGYGAYTTKQECGAIFGDRVVRAAR